MAPLREEEELLTAGVEVRAADELRALPALPRTVAAEPLSATDDALRAPEALLLTEACLVAMRAAEDDTEVERRPSMRPVAARDDVVDAAAMVLRERRAEEFATMLEVFARRFTLLLMADA